MYQRQWLTMILDDELHGGMFNPGIIREYCRTPIDWGYEDALGLTLMGGEL